MEIKPCTGILLIYAQQVVSGQIKLTFHSGIFVTMEKQAIEYSYKSSAAKLNICRPTVHMNHGNDSSSQAQVSALYSVVNL